MTTLIVFQGIGWFMAWQMMHWQARFEAQRVLLKENTPLETVVITQEQFEKAKLDKREIRLNGNLYDIRSKTVSGDSVRLELYHDRHEESLLAMLGIHFSKLDTASGNDSMPLALWVAQWLGSAFILPTASPLPACTGSLALRDYPFQFPHTREIADCPFAPPRTVLELA
jgi:hypothetical protein